jgi:hypothetical protein
MRKDVQPVMASERAKIIFYCYKNGVDMETGMEKQTNGHQRGTEKQ